MSAEVKRMKEEVKERSAPSGEAVALARHSGAIRGIIADGTRNPAPLLPPDGRDSKNPNGPWQIPPTWRWSTMGQEATIVGGGTPKTHRADYFGGDIPWITPADLSCYKEKYISAGARNITQAGLDNSGAKLMPTGTVLFSSRAPIGYVAIAANPVSTNQGFKSFVLKACLTPDFVYYYLQHAKKLALDLASGTTFQEISGKNAARIPIPVPPLSTQNEIVAEIEKQFTRLDAGVAALRRVQANLKRYRATVLKAACEGRLVPTEAEWHRTTLGDVATVLAGYGFPERLQGRSSGDIGFYKVGDISEAWKRHEKILTKANHYVSRSDQAGLRAKLLPPGTVVFAKIGAAIALNRRAVIGEPSLVDNNVMGVLAGERMHPRYLFHFLCTQKLDEVARATTVPSIRKGDVQGIEIDLPSLAEQTRIVAEVERRLSVIEELEAAVAANLQRASRLRQSVLQRAFSAEPSRREPSGLDARKQA